MSKSNVWTQVQELLIANKAKPALIEALEAILAPKQGGGSTNPPIEIDGVMHYYCRFHQRYEPETNMVMSAGKPKGYCKASISLWNKTNAQIKKLDGQVQELVTQGNFEEAQAIAKNSQALKANLNNPESYDYDRDWEVFLK